MIEPDALDSPEVLARALGRALRRRASMGIRRAAPAGPLDELPLVLTPQAPAPTLPEPAQAAQEQPGPPSADPQPKSPERAQIHAEAEPRAADESEASHPKGPGAKPAEAPDPRIPEPQAAEPGSALPRALEPNSPPPGPPAQAPRAPEAPSSPAPSAPAAMPPAPVAELDAEEVRRRAQAVAQLAAAAPDLAALEQAVAGCTACGLCATRTRTVFADGQGTRPILFLGEAPGELEDLSGVPFVGPAGLLLTDIVQKGMGLGRLEVSIANVLKCRPPGNRDPLPAEKAICTGWLERQIELLDPKVVVPLGRHASQFILGVEESMGRMRGRVHERQGRRVIPTYHPAYLLRSPERKKDCWQDIQLAMGELGLQRPQR